MQIEYLALPVLDMTSANSAWVVPQQPAHIKDSGLSLEIYVIETD